MAARLEEARLVCGRYRRHLVNPVTLLADLEEFIHDHHPHGPLTADATPPPAWNGYLLTVFLGRGAATYRLHHSSTRDWSASLSSVIRFMRSTISWIASTAPRTASIR
jgi:hypothetical protein